MFLGNEQSIGDSQMAGVNSESLYTLDYSLYSIV
jgi:hypothetical protein